MRGNYIERMGIIQRNKTMTRELYGVIVQNVSPLVFFNDKFPKDKIPKNSSVSLITTAYLASCGFGSSGK